MWTISHEQLTMPSSSKNHGQLLYVDRPGRDFRTEDVVAGVVHGVSARHASLGAHVLRQVARRRGQFSVDETLEAMHARFMKSDRLRGRFRLPPRLAAAAIAHILLPEAGEATCSAGVAGNTKVYIFDHEAGMQQRLAGDGAQKVNHRADMHDFLGVPARQPRKVGTCILSRRNTIIVATNGFTERLGDDRVADLLAGTQNDTAVQTAERFEPFGIDGASLIAMHVRWLPEEPIIL